MSAKLDSLEGERSQKASLLSELSSLVEHSGWKVFAQTLESQKTGRIGEILLRPLKSADEIYAQEFVKGEVSGLTLAQVSVFSMIESLKAEIRVLDQKVEVESEYSSERPEPEIGKRLDGSAYAE